MIRLAKEKDIEKLVEITALVVKDMIESGIDQWDETYPNREVFLEDVKNKELYIFQEGSDIIGYFVVNKECGDDYEGCIWSSDDFYIIHRIAVNPDFAGYGYGTILFNEIELIVEDKGCEYLRIDTNSSNFKMNNLIKKCNYKYLGDVQLQPDKPIWHYYDKKIK